MRAIIGAGYFKCVTQPRHSDGFILDGELGALAVSDSLGVACHDRCVCVCVRVRARVCVGGCGVDKGTAKIREARSWLKVAS